MWWILTSAFLVIVITIIILVIFNRGSGKTFKVFDDQLSSLQDCDLDGVKDFLDTCVCNPGEVKFDGCTEIHDKSQEKLKRGSTDCACLDTNSVASGGAVK